MSEVYAYTHKPFPKVLMCYVLEGRIGVCLSSDHYQFVQRHRTHRSPLLHCMAWSAKRSLLVDPYPFSMFPNLCVIKESKIPMPLYEKRGLTRAGQDRGVAVIFLHPERKRSSVVIIPLTVSWFGADTIIQSETWLTCWGWGWKCTQASFS